MSDARRTALHRDVPRRGYRFAGVSARREARDRRRRSTRCWRRIAPGSKAAPRSRRFDAIRSCARATSSSACCSSVARPRVGARRPGQRLRACSSRRRAPTRRPTGRAGQAAQHAREACRLDPAVRRGVGDAGIRARSHRRHVDGLAAARRAVALEPDNWRHHLRLPTWLGRGAAARRRRTLRCCPGCRWRTGSRPPCTWRAQAGRSGARARRRHRGAGWRGGGAGAIQRRRASLAARSDSPRPRRRGRGRSRPSNASCRSNERSPVRARVLREYLVRHRRVEARSRSSRRCRPRLSARR